MIWGTNHSAEKFIEHHKDGASKKNCWRYFYELKNNGFKSISCADWFLVIDEKTPFKPKLSLIHFIRILLHRNKKILLTHWLSKRGDDTRKDYIIHKIVLTNIKVKLQKVDNTFKISKERVDLIVHEYLYMRNLFSIWAPCLRTVDQKLQRVEIS